VPPFAGSAVVRGAVRALLEELPHGGFRALVIVVFAFAALVSEGVGWLQHRVEHYAAIR
jgi:hypothetical protein